MSNKNILESLSRSLIAGGRSLSGMEVAYKVANLSLSSKSNNQEQIIKELGNNRWVVSGVTSTNVDTIAYDGNTKELYVRFKSGSTYRYNNVPSIVALTFKSSPSKGQFVWYNIRGGRIKGSNYSYSKIGAFPQWVTNSNMVSNKPNRFFKQIK